MQSEILIKELLANILSEPQSIEILVKKDDLGTLFTISVAKRDMPVFMGRAGQNLNSIRRIITLLGAKKGERYSLRVNE